MLGGNYFHTASVDFHPASWWEIPLWYLIFRSIPRFHIPLTVFNAGSNNWLNPWETNWHANWYDMTQSFLCPAMIWMLGEIPLTDTHCHITVLAAMLPTAPIVNSPCSPLCGWWVGGGWWLVGVGSGLGEGVEGWRGVCGCGWVITTCFFSASVYDDWLHGHICCPWFSQSVLYLPWLWMCVLSSWTQVTKQW